MGGAECVAKDQGGASGGTAGGAASGREAGHDVAHDAAHEQLVAMGFARASVATALRACAGQRDDALQVLLSDGGVRMLAGPPATAAPPAPPASSWSEPARRVAPPAAAARDARVQRAAHQLLAQLPHAAETLATLRRLLGNVLRQPDEPKFRRIRRANKVIQRTIGAHPAAQELLAAIGFKGDDGELRLERPDLGLLWLAREALLIHVGGDA